jgi:DNA (cytosine-5)-methyltransferase 1
MRSIELFVGAGGLGIAASRAGFEPAVVIDWDKWACDTIRQNKQRGLAPFAHWKWSSATFAALTLPK